jgi:hypothetical protein
VVALIITAPERASFRRCRRQWDFSAGLRQNLEPRSAGVPDLDRAVRDALAVYYYPGMWDWDRGVRLPLVTQELERAVARQRGAEAGAARALHDGRALVARYLEWAPSVDRFAPVLVEADFEVTVPDPGEPSSGLVTAGGAAVRYGGRIDLLAVDQHDAYWIVRHRLVDCDGAPVAELAADEDSLAACWAWEQFYLGMAITGTIWNELRVQGDATADPEGDPASVPARRRAWLRRRRATAEDSTAPVVRQHEPSGGGRSVPQHRRMYARATEPAHAQPVEQATGPGFRRTWVRHRPDDVRAAGQRVAVDLAVMLQPDTDVSPEPYDRNCRPCPFLDPCQAERAGHDPSRILRARYQPRPAGGAEPGRLGGSAWGMGRGAAPPGFQRSRGG